MSNSVLGSMRLSWNVSALFGRYSSSSTGGAGRQLPPTEPGSLERRMVESYRGQTGGTIAVGTGQDNRHLVLRGGEAGLLNLRSFRSVTTPPPSIQPPPTQVSTSTGPGRILTDTLTDTHGETGSVGVPEDPGEALDRQLNDVAVSVGDALKTWRNAQEARRQQDGRLINRIFTTQAARDAARLEMSARGDAVRLASEALTRLDRLAAQLPPGAMADRVARAREGAMRDLLAASLGGAWNTRPMPPETTEAIDAAVRSLLDLHDRMRGTGEAGYGADTLIAALSHFGLIAPLGGSGDAEKLRMAAEGLDAVAGSVIEALTPPRDGAALNGLAGLSPELDRAVKHLRIDATTERLVEAYRATHGDADPDGQELARLRGVATRVVTDEMALAEPRRQIGRVLEKAGVPLSGAALQGVRIDGHLIATIRERFGKDTQAAGLVLAGLLIAERAARESPEAMELRTALGVLRGQADGDLGLDAGTRAQRLRGLDERIRSLGEENEPLRKIAEDAERNLRSVHRELRDIGTEKQRLASEQLRLLRSTDLLGAGPRLVEIAGRMADLKVREKDLTTRLPIIQRAAETTQADYNARAHNRTQAPDRLAYLSDREIDLLGLKGVSSLRPELVGEAAGKLARRGLASAQQAHDLAATVNRVMGRVDVNAGYRSRIIQSQERNFTGGRSGDVVGRLQDRLFLSVTGQVESFQHRQGSLQSALQSAVLTKGLQPLAGDDDDTLPIGLLGQQAGLRESRHRLDGQAQQYDLAKQTLLQQIAGDQPPRAAIGIYRILDARREIMGEETHGALRDFTRAAILAVMQESASSPDGFDPAQHADAIRGKLAGWGVDIAAFRPEIDMMLSQSFGETELALWIMDRPDRPDGPQGSGQDRLPGDSPGASLLRSFDDLANGSKIRLTATGGVEVTSGSIPLEPTGTASLTLSAGIDSVSMFEIARSGDNIDLLLTGGTQGKGGASVSASLMGHISQVGKELGLTAGISAGIEGGGSNLRGVALRFENNESGRQAARRMLEGLLSGRQLAPVDLAEAEIRPVVERGKSVKLDAQAKFGWEPKQLAIGSDLKTSATARLGVGFSVSTNLSVTENLGQRVVKTDTTKMIDVSAGIRLGVQGALAKAPWTENGSGGMQNWGSGVDIVDVSGQKILMQVSTWATIVQSPGGRIEKSTELQRATQAGGPYGLRGIDAMGGPLLERMMNPPQDIDPGKLQRLRELKEAITAMAGLASGGDQFVVNFSMRESVREQVNVMMERAAGLREGRVVPSGRESAGTEAARLEEEALALVRDEDNYLPTKVQVLAASDIRASLTPLNLLFVKVNEGIGDKRQGYTAEVSIPQDLLAEFDRGPGQLRPELPPEIDPQILHPLTVGSTVSPGVTGEPPIGTLGTQTRRTQTQDTPTLGTDIPLTEDDGSLERPGANGGEAILPTISSNLPGEGEGLGETGGGREPPRTTGLPPNQDIGGTTDQHGGGGGGGVVHGGGRRETVGHSGLSDQPSTQRVVGSEMFAMYQRDNECGVCAINAVLGENVVDEQALILTARDRNQSTTESARNSFDILTVATHMSRLQALGGSPIGVWPVGMAQAERGERGWRLPEVPQETDRLVAFQETREGDIGHRHFVAFRKDSDGEWWLLDSRNPGHGGPRRERISPEQYANRLGDTLQNFTLIGSGVGDLELLNRF